MKTSKLLPIEQKFPDLLNIFAERFAKFILNVLTGFVFFGTILLIIEIQSLNTLTSTSIIIIFGSILVIGVTAFFAIRLVGKRAINNFDGRFVSRSRPLPSPSYRPAQSSISSYRPLLRPEPTYHPISSSDNLYKGSGSETRSQYHTMEEKKSKFLSIPIVAFHYADKNQIKSFYNDYFKEPRMEDLISELIGEASRDVKGSIPQSLEVLMEGKDLSKWISEIKLPELSTAVMFLRYQRETIKKSQVTLGLEDVEINLEDLDKLEQEQKDLLSHYGLSIDDKVLESIRTQLKTKAVEMTLSKLEHATGWVVMEGSFNIEQTNENLYKFTYTHPVSEYLSESNTPITISVFVRVESLENRIVDIYKQSIGKQIPLYIYGKIWQTLDRRSGVWDIQIIPIAIY